jgi:hypothetical protein
VRFLRLRIKRNDRRWVILTIRVADEELSDVHELVLGRLAKAFDVRESVFV